MTHGCIEETLCVMFLVYIKLYLESIIVVLSAHNGSDAMQLCSCWSLPECNAMRLPWECVVLHSAFSSVCLTENAVPQAFPLQLQKGSKLLAFVMSRTPL